MIQAKPAPVKRKCKAKGCQVRFEPAKPWIRHCSDECGLAIGLAAVEKLNAAKARKAAKAERLELAARKEKIKTLSDHKRETQVVFNAWVRARDHGLPCISCGTSSGCKVNAGHFFSVGARPQHRYNPLNVHLQCEKCNSYLSGNIACYRPNLIAKIGQEAFDMLESDDKPRHYTADDLKALKAFYRAKTKELLK